MVGRVASLLWNFLQPILFILLLLRLNPGRDTQDIFSQDDYSQVVGLCEPFWSFIMLSIGALASTAILGTRLALILILLTSATTFGFTRPTSRFIKKHGRWRLRAFYPVCFALISSPSISMSGVPYAMAFSPGRAMNGTRIAPPLAPSPPTSTKTPDPLSMEDVFKMCVADKTPADTFFYPEVFNLLPFEEFDEQGETPSSLLHLSGYASEWTHMCNKFQPDDLDSLAKPSTSQGEADSVDPTVCSDLSDELSTVSSSPSVDSLKHSTSPDWQPLDFFSQPLQVPDEFREVYDHISSVLKNGQAIVTPAYRLETSDHLLDSMLILRRTKAEFFVDDAQVNITEQPRVFPVLLDTGCSVSSSGFKEDFEQLLDGDLVLSRRPMVLLLSRDSV